MIDIIKQFEGLKLEPYLDETNIPTIGYGNIQYPPKFRGGKKVSMKDMPITQEEADIIFNYWYEKFKMDVKSLLVAPVTENQLEALISLAYNIGIGHLRSSSLIKYINAIPDEFLKWNYAGGQKEPGLTNRRKIERQLYLTPDAPKDNIEIQPKKRYTIIEAIVSLFKGSI